MNVGRSAAHLTIALVGVMALAIVCPAPARAQANHSHPPAAQPQEAAGDSKNDVKGGTNELVSVVRQATERFKDAAVAESEGYYLQFGCVSGPDSGAMGLHYVNAPLVMDGELDPTHPEIVIYEPLPNGRVRLVGADFLVLADAWDAKNSGPPQLMGQLFHLFEAPNRFGLPAFYTLHVWAWKDSPTGTFVNWNPNVSCNAFIGQ